MGRRDVILPKGLKERAIKLQEEGKSRREILDLILKEFKMVINGYQIKLILKDTENAKIQGGNMERKKYLKLTEDQKKEILRLRNEGKTAIQIVNDFKEKGIILYPGKIYGIVKKPKLAKVDENKQSKPAFVEKAKIDLSTALEQEEKISTLELYSRLDRSNQIIRKHLRLKFLVDIAKNHRTMKKADLPIPPGDELPNEEEYYRKLIEKSGPGDEESAN